MIIQPAELQFCEKGLPRSSRFDDVYYSDASAVDESESVFLYAAREAPNWQYPGRGTPLTIAELGFGFGLNFMLTVRAWLQQCNRSTESRLHYLAFEKYPPQAVHLERVHGLWPELTDLAAGLRRNYPHCGSGCHRIHFHDQVILDLYLGDACDQMTRRIPRAVDCWYLDGFAPQANPELWDEAILAWLAQSSCKGTTLGSYSVAGNLRRGLGRLGFAVEKLPGFGRKRQRLFARFGEPAPPESANLYLPRPEPGKAAATATVVGAGLAGCAVAASLARRGWQVTVLDSAADAESGIGGIGQLSLGLRLFAEDSPVARFYLLAYLYSLRTFRQLAQQGHIDWHETGLVQLDKALNRRREQSASIRLHYPRSLLQALSQSELSAIAGLELDGAGYFLPASGYLDPAQLIQAWLDHGNIRLQRMCEITAIEKTGEQWILHGRNGEQFIDSVVIIAAGAASTRLEPLSELPLESVRGQVSRLPVSRQSSKLNTIVSGERTLFPASHNTHIVAASYGDEPEQETDARNLQAAAGLFDQAGILAGHSAGSATARRCRSSDYLPVLGPVPHWRDMTRLLAPLSRNAKHEIAGPGRYLPGLFISTAHGSNGLASCPLAGEYLASLVCAENLPLERGAVEALHPARFLLRRLKRQQPV